ncbi:MAG: signal peptide peptidase SppA [Pseudomonadota bacterium]
MSIQSSPFTVWGFIKGFGKLLIGVLLVLQGLIGLVMMLLFVGIVVSITNGVAGNNDQVSVTIPDESALVFNPNGVLVEQAPELDPFEQLIEEAYGVSEPMAIEVHDVVKVLRNAADDERVTGLVLDLGNLSASASSASKLHYVASEIRKFRESGKPVVAIGDYYSQEQYMLAAEADQIVMNNFGAVTIYGFAAYGQYVKSLLEKLKITSHVFRVGTFKSAVEPFIRDDMSDEAKEANRAFIGVLWDEYAASVEQARGLQSGALQNYADNLPEILRNSGGNLARAAQSVGLVDELQSRSDQEKMLIEKFGESRDGESFKSVGFRRYLASLEGQEDGDAPNIAVVTLSGAIVDGEAPVGQAVGGDTVAAMLRDARTDDDVKAVVLRVDSPGGSAFASEIIRDEVIAIKEAGKPVVASMGSLAASGGYWVSADADEIWAAPTTITGSIGIFGFFTTFENTAAEAGVFVDGVATSKLAPVVATGIGPLPEAYADIIQQSIEDGYDRFLTVVGDGRALSKSYVDSVGQGRVWIGTKAQDLKLVDKIGGYDAAIESAAALANLEDYDVVDMIEQRTPVEMILSNFGARAFDTLGLDGGPQRASAVAKLVREADRQVAFFEQFNDPNAAYARCLICE